jgi:hypothetical protein
LKTTARAGKEPVFEFKFKDKDLLSDVSNMLFYSFVAIIFITLCAFFSKTPAKKGWNSRIDPM